MLSELSGRYIQLTFDWPPGQQPIEVPLTWSDEDLLLWISDGHEQFRFMEMCGGELADFWSRSTLQLSCDRLRQWGLVEHTGKRGCYRLTDKGQTYLDQPAYELEGNKCPA